MATGQVAAPTSTGLEGIQSLLTLLGRSGGSTNTQTTTGGDTTQTTSGGGGSQTSVTTINPGDSSALEALLAELQGSDYSGLLEQVFQQAQGQIPGFQAAFQNAVGARSGSNGAVASMLQRLLQQTTTSAQSQLIAQQQANQQMRQGIGNSLMQNTRGTTQRQQVNSTQAPQTTVQSRAPATTVTQTQPQSNPTDVLGLMLAGQALRGMGGIGGVWDTVKDTAKGIFGEDTSASADAAGAATTSTPVNPMSGGAFGLPSAGIGATPISGGAMYEVPTLSFDQGYQQSLLPMDFGNSWNTPAINFMDGGIYGANPNYDFGGTDFGGGFDMGAFDWDSFGLDSFSGYDSAVSVAENTDWSDYF